MKSKENRPFWLEQTLPSDVTQQLVGIVELAGKANHIESKILMGDFARICYAWKLNSFEIMAQIVTKQASELSCGCGFVGKSIHSINAHKAKCKHERGA